MFAVVMCIATFLPPPAPDMERLDILLRELLLANTGTERQVIAQRILTEKGLTPKKLAAALRGVRLWEKQTAGVQQLNVSPVGDESAELQVLVEVPEKYNPKKRWPVLIALHGHGGNAEAMLAFARKMLGDRAREFLIAAPQDLGPIELTASPETAARPRELVQALRRRFHVDNDRVFLIGYSAGSHDAWMTTLMYPDNFAGVVPLATPLQVIGGFLLFDELLPNARNVPILFCWGAKDNLDTDGKAREDGGNAGLNRKMSEMISHLGFKHFEFVELPDVGHQGVVPPAKPLSTLLKRRRERYPRQVRQVFRLPAQGDAYWVSADRLIGEPLPDGDLRIPYAVGEDPLAAEKKWLIGKLGLVEAVCEGQTITLTTRRTGNVVLLLSGELLDLDKPVTIIRNEKKRWEGKITPDLRVMLFEAARSWDFERLPTSRVVVPVGGTVKFGYPTAGGRRGPVERPEQQDQGKSDRRKGDKKRE